MKRDYKLYNVMFPLWFLLIFPAAWLVILPANFIIDSLVLLLGIKLLKLVSYKEIYKRTIIKVWLLGFASDFVGGGILFLSTLGSGAWGEYLRSVSWNPLDNWYSLFYVAFAVVVTGVLIYLANVKLSFRNLSIDPHKKKLLALLIAILTAPYIFFYPSSLIYGGSFDRQDVMTHHILWNDEFRLEVMVPDDEAVNLAGKRVIMYSYQFVMRDAVNEASRISNENAIKSQPDYTLIFYSRDYTRKKEINTWIEAGNWYFQYDHKWYAFDMKEIQPFIKAMDEAVKIQGEVEFEIATDSGHIPDEESELVDKDGKKLSDYPVFEDSQNLYYCDKVRFFDDTVIVFSGGEKADIPSALESGLVTPQELIDHGLKLRVEPRN